MAHIEVTRTMSPAPEMVWPHLADLASHASWMKDAESIQFTTSQTSGVGTVMEVETRVGPLRTLDILEVTGWDEGRSIEVVHRGLVTGRGLLSLEATETGSVVRWSESLHFPWYLGGPLTAWLAKPVLSAIWRGNLGRLENRISSL